MTAAAAVVEALLEESIALLVGGVGLEDFPDFFLLLLAELAGDFLPGVLLVFLVLKESTDEDRRIDFPVFVGVTFCVGFLGIAAISGCVSFSGVSSNTMRVLRFCFLESLELGDWLLSGVGEFLAVLGALALCVLCTPGSRSPRSDSLPTEKEEESAGGTSCQNGVGSLDRSTEEAGYSLALSSSPIYPAML